MKLHHLIVAPAVLFASTGLDGRQPGRITGAVVAWNFAGFGAIPASRQALIVKSLLDLDPEVVAAVEVNPDEAIHDVAAALTELGSCYDALILDQTAGQNIGVLFKCGIQVVNPRLIPNSDDGNASLRKALAVDVRLGEFDFLVVGDYNMIPGADASNFNGLNPANQLRFISSEDLIGQFSHLSEGSGCDDGNLLDGFAIARTHTIEYIERIHRGQSADLPHAPAVRPGLVRIPRECLRSSAADSALSDSRGR